MTLQKIEFEYDIPDGYRFVRYDFAQKNELVICDDGSIIAMDCKSVIRFIIVEKILQQTKRHKHADLIHAWADGAEIQYYNRHDKWDNIDTPSWDKENKYRIKPKTKTVRFRNYLNENGGVRAWSSYGIPDMFVKWLGDWQEVEVEE